MTDTETARRTDFAACPILASYLATMLEDLQHTESDEACTDGREARDTGTIYTLPDEAYQTCKSDVAAWYEANRADIDEALDLQGDEFENHCRHDGISLERIGSTLYMVRVGHGVSFTDDGNADCLSRMDETARAIRCDSAYFGDDGKVYV